MVVCDQCLRLLEKRDEPDCLWEGVQELVVAEAQRDVSYKDLDHEDGHTGQDIHLVVEDAVVVHDVGRNQCFQDDAGSDMGMVVGDKMDGCSTLVVLVILQKNPEKGSVGDEQ